MDYKAQPRSPPISTTIPRLIIHGGSGNITRANLPPAQWSLYRASLLRILRSTSALLALPDTTALDACVHAVQLFESDPLFNCGKGAVFTREGRVELEASVMVSRGYDKRGVAVSMLRHVKSPIGLAKELLVRGNEEGGGGGQGHVHLSGEEVERLAREWGCEMCEENYFWTRKRWEEHRRGLERERNGEKMMHIHADVSSAFQPDGKPWPTGDPSWDGSSYLPQGTVGCVVLDRFGTLAVATSTGGLTNKLPGRIGDTPTIGAGFWAEEWEVPAPSIRLGPSLSDLLQRPLDTFLESTTNIFRDCFGISRAQSRYQRLSTDTPDRPDIPDTPDRPDKPDIPNTPDKPDKPDHPPPTTTHAVAMSGTGNGDSFLKLNAVRTVASLLRFSRPHHILPLLTPPSPPPPTLSQAITWMAGPNGELQKSAGDRWGRTGEGLAGIIGIEVVGGKGEVVADFNMGMFRAWVEEGGGERCMVFREEY